MDARLNRELPGGQAVNSDALGPPQSQSLRRSDEEIERVMNWSADRAKYDPNPPTDDPAYARGWNDAVAWCIGQGDFDPSGS